jgi:hypothetical protein
LPIEAALTGTDGRCGWRAAESGQQTVRMLFDEAQDIRRLQLCFVERERKRTQEFVLRWSADGTTYHDILRQQWNFSPTGSTEELEDFRVHLCGVRALEVRITPDINGGEARASLTRLRVG